MANADSDKQPDAVSSVMKVFGILQALGDEREIGITELSQRVMMSKSTVYRFLQTMKALGYVSQEGETEKYALTLKLFELGAKSLQNVDLIRSADVQMRELSNHTRETIHLGALDEDGIVYIHKIDAMYNLRMYSRIGRRNSQKGQLAQTEKRGLHPANVFYPQEEHQARGKRHGGQSQDRSPGGIRGGPAPIENKIGWQHDHAHGEQCIDGHRRRGNIIEHPLIDGQVQCIERRRDQHADHAPHIDAPGRCPGQ